MNNYWLDTPDFSESGIELFWQIVNQHDFNQYAEYVEQNPIGLDPNVMNKIDDILEIKFTSKNYTQIKATKNYTQIKATPSISRDPFSRDPFNRGTFNRGTPSSHY